MSGSGIRGVVYTGQTRKIIYDVYKYMIEECSKEVHALKKTAAATKASLSTVKRIVAQCKDSDSNLLDVFKTPGKTRPRKKTVTGLDSFDKSVVKRCIHNFHLTEKEFPTVEKLRRKLHDDIGFNGSAPSLRRIIKELSFRWRRTINKKQILVEKTNIRLLRIEYLQKMKKYREEGRTIVYTDELHVDSAHLCTSTQRLFIVHAGSEAGFLPKSLCVIKTGTKNGDCQDKINFMNYEKWLCSRLLPNLPPNSVVVVNNAPYHYKHLAPSANSKKATMQNWLSKRGIPYSEQMFKPQLYNLIKDIKITHKKNSVDEILSENNHTLLCLPPYHPDLNPMEMAWAAIKEDVTSKITKLNIQEITNLVTEKVTAISATEWTNLCEKVKMIEAEYMKSDCAVDFITEQLVIFEDDETDDDDLLDESEDDETDKHDEPIPGTSMSIKF